MTHTKVRRQIAYEAARLMYDRDESEYYRAKWKAARKVLRGWVKPRDLPSNAEIRDELQTLARLHEGSDRAERQREMRLEALRMMRQLRAFRPRLVGSVLTGHVRQGSDIDIHVFTDSLESVEAALEDAGLSYHVEHKDIVKHGQRRHYIHIHVAAKFPHELTLYPAAEAHVVTRSSVTGKPMERASIAELEQFLAEIYPDVELDEDTLAAEAMIDRFDLYRLLLLPLEDVKQRPDFHPEGDALYHSLQVFELARSELPYDEEFLLAALLHDVGKAIDPHDHVAAGLEALEGYITGRTAWLIAHHMEAGALATGTLGARSRRRLERSEDFDELVLLGQCDRQGRECGVEVPDVEDALEYVQELARLCGG
ncbi:MAG: HD domain-containing protein [Pirellulales bacterium]